MTVAETGGLTVLEAVTNRTLKSHVAVYEPAITLQGIRNEGTVQLNFSLLTDKFSLG
ncbi:hypothetical protein [Nocardia alni]|uniref:hypothetical protein n=1 Tax=Nocardia alni TaxID=2815723 RepID=UPI001C250DCF|nr:hypothetical protein [Nocardia alni]